MRDELTCYIQDRLGECWDLAQMSLSYRKPKISMKYQTGEKKKMQNHLREGQKEKSAPKGTFVSGTRGIPFYSVFLFSLVPFLSVFSFSCAMVSLP